MKYNKFLLALALCISISSNMSFAQQANGWGSSATTVYNAMKSHGNKIFDAGASFMTNISMPIFNKMSSWTTNNIFYIVTAGLTILMIRFGAPVMMKWFLKKSLNLAEATLPNALPSSINDFQKAAALISQEETTNLNQKLFDKYYNDYTRYINAYKQYIENKANNSLNKINPLIHIIDLLITEVANPNYIFSNNESVVRHNIILNIINKPYITTEEEMPGYYVGKSINDIPGL